MSQRPDSGPVPDIEKQINDISEKVPVLDALEKKATEMKDLQPEMKDLSKKLDQLGDFSDMKMAKLAGQTIKQIYQVNDMSIDPSTKSSLLDDVNARYEASKGSFLAMERNIAAMDTKIATTRSEKASIDNLPPIPAGPAFIAENERDTEPVEKKAGGLDRATVTKLVTDDMQKKGLIDQLEAKFAQPEPSQEFDSPNARGTTGAVDQLTTGNGILRPKEVALPANFQAVTPQPTQQYMAGKFNSDLDYYKDLAEPVFDAERKQNTRILEKK